MLTSEISEQKNFWISLTVFYSGFLFYFDSAPPQCVNMLPQKTSKHKLYLCFATKLYKNLEDVKDPLALLGLTWILGQFLTHLFISKGKLQSQRKFTFQGK